MKKAEPLSVFSDPAALTDEIDLLRARIHNAKEIYIGMDGFIPESAAEAYLLCVLRMMYEELEGTKGAADFLDRVNARAREQDSGPAGD